MCVCVCVCNLFQNEGVALLCDVFVPVGRAVVAA